MDRLAWSYPIWIKCALQRLMGACVDITDRKRAEEEVKRIRHLEGEMRQVSRTETIEELTASLAHELNQRSQQFGLMRKLRDVFLPRKIRS